MKKRKKLFPVCLKTMRRRKKRKSIVKVSALNSNVKSFKKTFAFVLFQVFSPKIRQMRIFHEYMAVLNCDT